MRGCTTFQILRKHTIFFCFILTGSAFSTEVTDFFRTETNLPTPLDQQLEQLLTADTTPEKKPEEDLEHFFHRNPNYTPAHKALIDFTNFLKTRISLFETDRLYGRLLLDYQLLIKYTHFTALLPNVDFG